MDLVEGHERQVLTEEPVEPVDLSLPCGVVELRHRLGNELIHTRVAEVPDVPRPEVRHEAGVVLGLLEHVHVVVTVAPLGQQCVERGAGDPELDAGRLGLGTFDAGSSGGSGGD